MSNRAMVGIVLVGVWMLAMIWMATEARAGAPTVSPWEYRHADIGDTRHQTQTAFDTTGVRVWKWAGEAGDLHLRKTYPATGGGTVWVTYVSRGEGHPYRLVEKERTA